VLHGLDKVETEEKAFPAVAKVSGLQFQPPAATNLLITRKTAHKHIN